MKKRVRKLDIHWSSVRWRRSFTSHDNAMNEVCPLHLLFVHKSRRLFEGLDQSSMRGSQSWLWCTHCRWSRWRRRRWAFSLRCSELLVMSICFFHQDICVDKWRCLKSSLQHWHVIDCFLLLIRLRVWSDILDLLIQSWSRTWTDGSCWCWSITMFFARLDSRISWRVYSSCFQRRRRRRSFIVRTLSSSITFISR